MRYRALLSFVLVALTALTASACGASRQGPSVSSPFTERDATLFEDGVDMMVDPDALHGQWRQDWEEELTERIEHSDVVFEGELISIQVDSDPDQRKSYRAALAVTHVHRGDLYGAKEVALVTREGALGYASIASDPERLLRHSYMAFVKYAEAPDGAPRPIAHFHIAPPSLAMHRALIGDRAKKPRTVKVGQSTTNAPPPAPATGAAP